MDKSKQAADIFNKKAQQYMDKYMNVDLYDASFDIFCENLQHEKATVLDIACGPGNITRYLLQKYPDYQIMGIDLAPEMLKLAKVNNPTADFMEMDARSIGGLNRTFDGIVVGFCLPYLSKEEAIQLINDAANLLNRGGVLYISTMEDDYEKSAYVSPSSGDGEKLFMHYHEEVYLRDALIQNGFKIMELWHQDYPLQEGMEIKDLIIISKKE